MAKETLSITDNRTGKTYEVPITDGTIRTADLRQIRTGEEDFGIMGYDPAFMNTASCRSAITFIDGDKGILRYRGYRVDELAEKAGWTETAYLILNGELPTKAELDAWEAQIKNHTFVHENVRALLSGFRYDAHPMGMLMGGVGALSTFYPEAKDVLDAVSRRRQITRLIAKVPTLAAWAYRHSRGLPFVYPDPDLSYSANFLRMLKQNQEPHYDPHPDVVKALDVLFILHADHEQNCSTNVMRSIGSSQADPYSAIAGATAALWGPLHGGANEAVLKMLKQLGKVENVADFVKQVKDGSAGQRLMGFGHRVYKNYDPLLEIALELERIALSDEYFVSRKLYPNVDFYSGLIYEALEIPVEMYTVMFAIPRTVGWLAQWEEMIVDKEQKIARPRQIYTGYDERPFTAMASRKG
jgi:citrate synthase